MPLGDHEVGLPVSQRLTAREGEVNAVGEAHEFQVPLRAVKHTHSHLVHDVDRQQTGERLRVVHFLSDHGPVCVPMEVLLLELEGHAESTQQRVLQRRIHSLGRLHSHAYWPVGMCQVFLALLVLGLDLKDMLDVEDVSVEPHLHDEYLAHELPFLHVQGRLLVLVHLVKKLGECVIFEGGDVDAVGLEQGMELVLLVRRCLAPRVIHLAMALMNCEVLKVREAERR
mmetsp:Transcript_54122/g.150552  ORF Transcript_54122/g.150552 Transcript_54122/m.150552 type:complete len:227 (-) Transcript_54122:1246-1926(-)